MHIIHIVFEALRYFSNVPNDYKAVDIVKAVVKENGQGIDKSYRLLIKFQSERQVRMYTN